MFSIKTPYTCKITKNINTGVTPNLYVYNNIIYTNSTINSAPKSSCIINISYGKQLINDPYNPLKNPLT